MVPHAEAYGKRKMELMGYFFKKMAQESRVGWLWEDLRRVGGNYDQNTSYEILKKFYKKKMDP